MDARAKGTSGFGALLRRHRLAAGLSQEALAERARMSVEGISALERGFRRTPLRETLALLVGALALSDEQRQAFENAARGGSPRRREASVTIGPWPSSGAPNAPFALTTFVGRDAELAALRTALARTSIAAIFGLGGVGKSSLAREYALRERDRYSAILWLDAQTEDGIIEGLLRFGATHVRGLDQIANRRVAAQQVVDSVLRGFDKQVLLIFDNLEDERRLRAWLPRSGARALATSRNAIWSPGVTAIPLEPWRIETGVEYLRRESQRDLTEADARAIVEGLGGLPLALAHAAASLRGMRMLTPARYLQHFRAHLKKAPHGAEYPQSVFATFKTAIEQAEREGAGAAALLSFAALFAPDAIPDELFRQPVERYASNLSPGLSSATALDLHSVVADEMSLDGALGALDRLSLLVFSEESRTYRIHRLVQLASQDLIAPKAPAWHECAINVAEAAFPSPEFSQWPQCARLLPHACTVLESLPSDAVFESAGRLAFRCANYLTQRGEYDHAEALNARALATNEKLVGLEHPDVALNLNLFGIVYRQQGRYSKAEEAHARAQMIREQAFGSDHLVVSHSLNNLATVYRDQGRYADAAELHRRALKIREDALGSNHADVAESLANLADAYAAQGRFEDAVALHGQALTIREEILNPDHPLLAVSLSNIGEVYCKQGQYAEAEVPLTRALEIREKTVATAPPDLGNFLINLANLRRRQGRYEEAEQLLRRALAIRESSLTPDHPDIVHSLCELADLYNEQGRAEDAAPLYARALALREKAF